MRIFLYIQMCKVDLKHMWPVRQDKGRTQKKKASYLSPLHSTWKLGKADSCLHVLPYPIENHHCSQNARKSKVLTEILISHLSWTVYIESPQQRVGTRWPTRSLPTQTTAWFYEAYWKRLSGQIRFWGSIRYSHFVCFLNIVHFLNICFSTQNLSSETFHVLWSAQNTSICH